MGANIMLAVHCKKADPVDIRGPISDYVAMTYGDSQAADAGEDLESIQSQRAQIVGMGGSLASLRDLMAKYYRALATMETRFPISREASHVHISFTWYDAFRPTKRCEQASIHFEKAAVLFNLGALQSQLALQTERTTDAGVKEAAKLFQEAAGTYAYLRDVASVKVELPRPVDVGPECAHMLERLMLAQAQECVHEKAVMDKKSPALLARIAKQVSALYAEVAGALQAPPLSSHFDKSWGAHIGVKAGVYEAQSILDAAAAAHADDKIGAEITRLREAQKALLGPKKDARSCSKELQASVKEAEEAAARALVRAEKENSTVYLQRIPPASELPPIAGAMLVKPLLPALDASAEGLFNSVIPDNSAKALSRYTDLVDGLARAQRDLLEGASDEARIRLREWELPEALQSLDAGSVASLPEAVRVELEGIEDSGGVRFLQEMSTQIRELRRVAEEELGAAEGQLNEEAAEDSDLRARHGAAWNRPASTALNASLREKVASYRSNLAAAADSDARLDAKLAASSPAFAALTVDAAATQMPRLQAPMVAVGDADPASVVASLRHALEALTRLSAERAALEEALKAEKNRDNILPRIMASSDNYDALFQEELKKYDALKRDIKANVEKQAELLRLVGQQQATYKTTFGFTDWRQACEGAASGVRGQVGAFKEVRDNLSEGLRFYMSLQEAVVALRQQIGDFCLTRRIQREEMVEEQRRREADEARNRRAAQDLAASQGFQRLSLGSSAGSAASSAQNYPPAYQNHAPPQPQHAYGNGPPSAPPQLPQPPQQPGYGGPPAASGPPPSHSLPPSGGYGQPQAPAYPPQQQHQQHHQPPPAQTQYGQPPAHGYPPAHPTTPQQQGYAPYGQAPPAAPSPYGSALPPQQPYGTSMPAAHQPPPQHGYGAPQPPQYGQQPPPTQQYGYGGAPTQQYGSYGAPGGSYGGAQGGGGPPPQQQQDQGYYGSGGGYGQGSQNTSGSNPLWSGR